MNHMELEDASNDDTTIISELLNSAEAMQQQVVSSLSVPATTASVSTTKIQLQQNNIQNTDNISATFGDASKQIVTTPQQRNYSSIMNSTPYMDTEDLNKMNIRHVHIPYILNGELYQIQTQDGENVTVKCCHCPPDRVYRGSVRSTGNFHMHIKRRHPDLLEKLHDMKVHALLERRDRLMRNRKISHRHNRNRSTNINSLGNSNEMCSLKNEEKLEIFSTAPSAEINLNSPSELSLMHTHKLKIKTVFQRHQMQQREAAEMRNWSNTEYVVMPISKVLTNEESEQPINYSLKSPKTHETQISYPSFESNPSHQKQETETKKLHDNTNQIPLNNLINSSNQPTNLTIINNEDNVYNSDNLSNSKNLSTSSISISCPSVASSYSSNHHYEIDTITTTNRQFNSLPHHHNLTIIKPENFLLESEVEAIDLTMHTDSGIFSNSDDSGSLQQNDSYDNNNNNNNSISDNNNNNIIAGSKNLNTANNSTTDIERNNNNNNDSCNNNNTNSTNTTKWQELLMQVENSLRDIQREMNVRNQIESNRMFLDIAKFKFLNPGFQFNW